MAEILDNIIDNLNNDRLTTALELCEQNKDKKIEHIISNIKGVILFKQKNYKFEFVKSINKDKLSELANTLNNEFGFSY